MSKAKICSSCGTVGRAKTVTRGSLLIEIFLWLCLIVPGLLYSLWRLTSRHKACGACGAQTLIPLDSPLGRQLQSKISSTQSA
jgi:hypothetical protein